MTIQKDLWSFYEKHVSHTMVVLWNEWYHSLLWGDSIRKGADLEKQNGLFGVHPAVMGKLTSLSIKGRVSIPENIVTASSYRSLITLTEVEEPAKMGESLGTGAHRHRSIFPPGVKYVPGPRVLRRILSNRS